MSSSPTHSSVRRSAHVAGSTSLEALTILHVALLVLVAAWAFGGNAPWVRTLLSVWGSLGVAITIAACVRRRHRAERQRLMWLWPLGLFNAIVLVSAFNPSFREVTDGARTFYVQEGARWPLPSTARPALSLATLWFLDAVYLSCFNLLLVVRRRRALRALLFALAGNALVLAAFGTVQKLSGADGLFFGAVKSPQVYFFSSFIYHNHWGAFIVLMTAAALGLVFHFSRRSTGRDFWHSPALTGLVAILLLAISVPLSTSRSCTVLVLLVLAAAMMHGLWNLVRRRRAQGGSIARPIALSIAAAILAGTFVYSLAGSTIEKRLDVTRDQIADLRARGDFGSRQILYRDTWHMAQEKLWFGWGMATYPTVFYLHNTQQYGSPDGLPLYFHDAHSDWLQSFSEVGLAGTALLGLCALVPLYASRRYLSANPITLYLGGGCALIVLYAWLEFPFGNRAVICAWWTCFFTGLQYARLRAGEMRSTASEGLAHPSASAA